MHRVWCHLCGKRILFPGRIPVCECIEEGLEGSTPNLTIVTSEEENRIAQWGEASGEEAFHILLYGFLIHLNRWERRMHFGITCIIKKNNKNNRRAEKRNWIYIHK